MDEAKLIEAIEAKRLEMVQLAEEKGKLIDGNIIAVSQTLDVLLLQYQRISVNKNKRKSVKIVKPSA